MSKKKVKQAVDELSFEVLQVEWVAWENVKPNEYNPNVMTPQDRLLLRQSLLEDGWVQPLVVLSDYTIVDGEQRWTVAGQQIQARGLRAVLSGLTEEADEEGQKVNPAVLDRVQAYIQVTTNREAEGKVTRITDLTGGEVPVVVVDVKDEAHAILSTLRYNTARGVHQQQLMINIIQDLHKLGFDFKDFQLRLGMGRKEVDKYLVTLPMPESLDLPPGYSESWEITHITKVGEEQAADMGYDRSLQVEVAHEMMSAKVEEREQLVLAAKQQALSALAEDAGVAEKAQALFEAEKSVPRVRPPQLDKFIFYVSDRNLAIVERALALFGDKPVDAFVAMCEMQLPKFNLKVET